MSMKVKATVVLDVKDVQTWEEAYKSVFAMVGYYARGALNGAYVSKVITVEGLTKQENAG